LYKYFVLKGTDFSPSVVVANINRALEVAETLSSLPFGGSRGLQTPEKSQGIQGL
jgi:hypothetical protein